jgi:3-methyladenine DNA glycosylase AlkC
MASQLKHFYGREVIEALGRDFARAHPRFDAGRFVTECLDGLDDLELLARAWHIAEALRRQLPSDFPKAARVLIASLDTAHTGPLPTGMATFRYLPHVFYVSKYGLDHLDDALRVQYEVTQRFTAEFSIRAFLDKYPRETLVRMREWAADPSHHVRRLVSEGTRPRLPWAPRLREFQKNPVPVLELLELLKDDPELYVRRSVANNLNDISKDHPAIAIEVCKRWMVSASPERKWIVSHALRVLVKKGHPGALAIMGVGAKPKVKVSGVTLSPKTVRIGGKLSIEFQVTSNAAKRQTLQVDFQVHFVKANGKTAPKVFKLKRLELAPRETATLSARVSFAPMTTRKPYPGIHKVDVLINGIQTPLGHVAVK